MMKKIRLGLIFFGLFILALLFISPFYFVIVNSIKEQREILVNPAALPTKITFDNFKNVWEMIRFPRAFFNSFVITFFSTLGIVVLSSMTAYRITRVKSRFHQLLFSIFIASMVIPFQSIMLPLVKVVADLNISNSYVGLILCYFGFGAPLAIFLYSGFVNSIPRTIEEAAIIDGCTTLGVFIRVVFPLMAPMTATVIILNTLWIWNDFLMPSLLLQSKELKTIPIEINNFFSMYTKKWDLAIAGLAMAISPMILFFLSLQKYVVSGIVAGSVKG